MEFGILGGDKRQGYLAQAIAEDGHSVAVCGLGEMPQTAHLKAMDFETLTKRCSLILLPLPATRDGRYLFAPGSQEAIPLGDGFAEALKGAEVYGGLMDPVVKTSRLWQEIDYGDYYKEEALVLGNAMLTAEGAVAKAIEAHPGGLHRSRCLVTGFGRIGKDLCRLLRGFGARVDCAARKPRDLVGIRTLGVGALEYGEIRACYDVIFNTVPQTVLGSAVLERQDGETLILELASKPGGVDPEAASRQGIRVLDCPSLPGLYSPMAAGTYIKEAVYHMMAER